MRSMHNLLLRGIIVDAFVKKIKHEDSQKQVLTMQTHGKGM